jgi:hypothetical protein
MNKLIIILAFMMLSKSAMGKEKNTLEKAQEVAILAHSRWSLALANSVPIVVPLVLMCDFAIAM